MQIKSNIADKKFTALAQKHFINTETLERTEITRKHFKRHADGTYTLPIGPALEDGDITIKKEWNRWIGQVWFCWSDEEMQQTTEHDRRYLFGHDSDTLWGCIVSLNSLIRRVQDELKDERRERLTVTEKAEMDPEDITFLWNFPPSDEWIRGTETIRTYEDERRTKHFASWKFGEFEFHWIICKTARRWPDWDEDSGEPEWDTVHVDAELKIEHPSHWTPIGGFYIHGNWKYNQTTKPDPHRIHLNGEGSGGRNSGVGQHEGLLARAQAILLGSEMAQRFMKADGEQYRLA